MADDDLNSKKLMIGMETYLLSPNQHKHSPQNQLFY